MDQYYDKDTVKEMWTMRWKDPQFVVDHCLICGWPLNLGADLKDFCSDICVNRFKHEPYEWYKKGEDIKMKRPKCLRCKSSKGMYPSEIEHFSQKECVDIEEERKARRNKKKMIMAQEDVGGAIGYKSRRIQDQRNDAYIGRERMRSQYEG